MIRTTISILCLLGAGAIFFMYTQPTYDSVQAENAQIAQYDEALSKASELQQLKQSLLSRYNTFDPGQIDRLQKLLPDHVDNVRLILDIDSLAGKYGMALQNVAVSEGDSASGSQQAATSIIGASKQPHGSLTIKFTTQGSYDTFRQFLTALESSLRIVDLVSLNIARGGSSTQANAAELYTFNITLRTYWLK